MENSNSNSTSSLVSKKSIQWIMPGIMPHPIPGFFESENMSKESVKQSTENTKNDASVLPLKYQLMAIPCMEKPNLIS